MGKNYYHFSKNETPFNNSCSANIALNKYCTSKLLEKEGIPVPKAISLNFNEFQQNLHKAKVAPLHFPLVIKPIDGSLGIGVLCNIRTLSELETYLEKYFSSYPTLLIEEFHSKLNSYRVLVFNNRILGIVQRYPAAITGDRVHTIKELITLENLHRKRINEALGEIIIDDESRIKLQELGITENYIPALGEKIVLCYTSNATRGGTYTTLNKKMCKKNRKLLFRVSKVLNLPLAGIDVECPDIINIPIEQSNGVILEVNHKPSIRIHEFPMTGKPQRVTKKIMRSLIIRHPLAYLYSIYNNQPTAFYVRSIILITIMGLILLMAW
ncbi:UDP-N-acetylmuramyl peptide synthase [Legionella norrlandica]|uniref:UDP-N-acetylmuramyl peptide synthase n=1 Tax=Legionella norrlandica TaxID=1498499 RepID=A0A0A2SPW5_9GAMM|nr:UDP-N-acetylmuramyl peptide synthase [Legionella norrlandica]KGP62792.1 UDP-N-acetylmuramyl peptide synthase [Legionella norrlandica]